MYTLMEHCGALVLTGCGYGPLRTTFIVLVLLFKNIRAMFLLKNIKASKKEYGLPFFSGCF